MSPNPFTNIKGVRGVFVSGNYVSVTVYREVGRHHVVLVPGNEPAITASRNVVVEYVKQRRISQRVKHALRVLRTDD